MACSRRNEHDVPCPSWPMDSKITFLFGPILSEKTIWTKNERSFFQPAVRGRPACLWASISVHDIEVSPIVRDRPKTWFTTGIDSLQSCRRNRIPTGSFRVQVGLAEDPNNALDNLYYPYPCCMSWYIFVDFHGWLRTATDSTHIHEGLSKFSNFSGSQVGKESLVCLEGKSMTPRRGITILFIVPKLREGAGPCVHPPERTWCKLTLFLPGVRQIQRLRLSCVGYPHGTSIVLSRSRMSKSWTPESCNKRHMISDQITIIFSVYILTIATRSKRSGNWRSLGFFLSYPQAIFSRIQEFSQEKTWHRSPASLYWRGIKVTGTKGKKLYQNKSFVIPAWGHGGGQKT